MEQGQISVQTENIFPIIKQFLYSDQEIFLRELISNAIDATQKIKTLNSKGKFKGKVGDLTIDVILDEEAGTLTIRDHGVGMTEEEIKKYLNQVAFSSAQEFLEKYKDKEDSNIIGHFGLGFYSSFMVSDKVEVITKSWQEDASSVKWTCEGEPAYTIEEAEREERGTDVVLYINEEEDEYLDENRINGLLDTYCKFLPIEIRFGTKTETKTVGEGEDAETEEIEVDNIINNTHPLWKKQPTDLTDEEYKQFYNELYPMSAPPLFWIHLNIDFPFNLTGILYFPHLKNNMEVQKNKIQLYSNQVYVTDEVKDIVPEFLTLLHGVIDSPDIPLNVSRSYLQADRNVKKIAGYITKKVGDKLQEIFDESREEYEKKWKQINVFVKYGMLSDDKFYKSGKDFALLRNTEGEYYTIEEYLDKVKDAQTDKDDKTVLIYAQDKQNQLSYINAVKEKGYDVLMMDEVIDTHFMQHLEQQEGSIQCVRVDADIPDKLVDKDEERESVLSEKEQEKVENIFKESLGDDNIQLKALSPAEGPLMITRPEFMRRMKEMQAMQGMDMNQMPDQFNIIVNSNHPLIADKLVKMRSEEKINRLAKHLFDLAKLNQNMLSGEELSRFVDESISIMKNA